MGELPSRPKLPSCGSGEDHCTTTSLPFRHIPALFKCRGVVRQARLQASRQARTTRRNIMNALPTRIVIVAMAALIGASVNGHDAQAQIRVVNGIQFSPSGSWNISAGEFGGKFIPQINFTPRLSIIPFHCCSNGNYCIFKREDTGEYHVATDATDSGQIISTQTFSGFTANPDGSAKRYPISLSAMCGFVTQNGINWRLPVP
jgi:hypothetical protein